MEKIDFFKASKNVQKAFSRLVFDALGQTLELSINLSSELAPSYFESDCAGKKYRKTSFLGEI